MNVTHYFVAGLGVNFLITHPPVEYTHRYRNLLSSLTIYGNHVEQLSP